jgi:hypothetical protein
VDGLSLSAVLSWHDRSWSSLPPQRLPHSAPPMHKQQRTCLVSDLNVGALLISDTFFCSRTHPAMLESFRKAATDELLSSVISFKEKYMLLCPALEHFLKRGASLVPQNVPRAEKVGDSNVSPSGLGNHRLYNEELEYLQCWKGKT